MLGIIVAHFGILKPIPWDEILFGLSRWSVIFQFKFGF
jgi:hypothetical protein